MEPAAVAMAAASEDTDCPPVEAGLSTSGGVAAAGSEAGPSAGSAAAPLTPLAASADLDLVGTPNVVAAAPAVGADPVAAAPAVAAAGPTLGAPDPSPGSEEGSDEQQ